MEIHVFVYKKNPYSYLMKKLKCRQKSKLSYSFKYKQLNNYNELKSVYVRRIYIMHISTQLYQD